MLLLRVKAAALSLDTASLAWSRFYTPLLGQKTAGVFAAQAACITLVPHLFRF